MAGRKKICVCLVCAFVGGSTAKKGVEFVMFGQTLINKKSRVSNQNGVSLLYIMFEIHHSGRGPSK